MTSEGRTIKPEENTCRRAARNTPEKTMPHRVLWTGRGTAVKMFQGKQFHAETKLMERCK